MQDRKRSNEEYSLSAICCQNLSAGFVDGITTDRGRRCLWICQYVLLESYANLSSNCWRIIYLVFIFNLMISFSRAVRYETLHRRIRLHYWQDLSSGQSAWMFLGNSGSPRISVAVCRTEITMGWCDSSCLLGNGPSQLRGDFSAEVCCWLTRMSPKSWNQWVNHLTTARVTFFFPNHIRRIVASRFVCVSMEVTNQ